MDYCTIDWKDIQIHGDLAYEWGINRQKMEFPAPRKPFEGNGKILLILKRQPNGSWKVAVEAWNGNPERAGSGGRPVMPLSRWEFAAVSALAAGSRQARRLKNLWITVFTLCLVETPAGISPP